MALCRAVAMRNSHRNNKHGAFTMNRRILMAGAVGGVAGNLATPAIVSAQTSFNWRMTSFYGPQAAF
jgi:hypothetical protein